MTTPAPMITTGSNEAGRLNAGAIWFLRRNRSAWKRIEGRVSKLTESADALIDPVAAINSGADRHTRRHCSET